MNTFVIFFCATLAVSSASYAYSSIGQTSVLQGPSSSSQVVGPDGTVIVAGAPGGKILTSEAIGYTAPAVVAKTVVPAPVIPKTILPAPVVAKTVLPVPVVPKTVIPAPVVPKTVVPASVIPKSVVPAPLISKSIYTTYSSFVPASAPLLAPAYAAPAVVPTYAAPGVVAKAYVASPVTASGYPILAPGSGLEGQYVPDITEKLYDDGSYKPEISEKLYDDGAYKGELVAW